MNFFVQLQHSVNESLRGRRAAGHININGDYSVAAAHDRIGIVIIAASIGAGAHRDHPARLLGVEPQKLLGPSQPLENVISGPFLSACQAILQAADDEPFQRIEDVLKELWTGQRSAEGKSLVLLTDWVHSQMTRAAHSKPGRGARQLQRLIKSWTGQSYRDLQMFARVEQAYLCRARNLTDKGVDFAGVAADAGYADQSHMGREIRRMTSFSPKQFDRMMASEEGFWLYRLFAEQFGG